MIIIFLNLFYSHFICHLVSHHEGCLRVPPLEPGHEVVHHEESVVIRLDEEVQPRPVLLPHLHQTKLHLQVRL